MASEFNYAGQELGILAHAVNWKSYVRTHVRRYLRGDVLEVGTGRGATSQALINDSCRTWTCLEPDPALLAQASQDLSHVSPERFAFVNGTVADLSPDRLYDAILYIDVLEHIEDDVEEALMAAQRLAPGGALIILAPAHQRLFCEFDAAVGHLRRYNRRSLVACVPKSLVRRKLVYLDSVGLMASLANRLMLRQSMPTLQQILTWDRILVRLSRIMDPLTAFCIGKSILGIWANSVPPIATGATALAIGNPQPSR
jgi:SAM-dependent methyltransferase